MGLSSKRRGGSGSGSTHSAGSSSGGGGSNRELGRSVQRRNKDRGGTSNDHASHESSKKRRMGGRRGTASPPVLPTNSAGGSSNHHHHHPSSGNHHHSSSSNHHNDNSSSSKHKKHHHQQQQQQQKRELEPTVLARGMSSRMVGARISQHLTILNPEDTEKDLRHMEAYANACTAYGQQFFIFHNRSLVQSGHFGPVSAQGLTVSGTGPAPGGGTDTKPGGPHSPGKLSTPYNDGGTPTRPRGAAGGAGTPSRLPPPPHAGQFAMPVRIDPEEEKRVANLRKKIAASEAQREVLEAEYMSLRAHFVNESQRLKRTRQAVDGQLKLLQDLILKRGKVLALRRVRCGVAKDILACLERRAILMDMDVGDEEELSPAQAPHEREPQETAAASGAVSSKEPTEKDVSSKTSAAVAAAAMSSNNTATPVDTTKTLSKPSSTGDNDAMDIDRPATMAKPQDAAAVSSTTEQQKQQVAVAEEELADVLDVWNDIEEQLVHAEKECVNISLPQDLVPDVSMSAPPPTNGKKKYSKSSSASSSSSKEKGDTSDTNTSTSNNHKKKQRRGGGGGSGSNATSDDDSTSKKDIESDTNSTLQQHAKNVVITAGQEDGVVLWESQIMPRTPYGVPVYFSHLSGVPDKAAAYGVDGVFGSKKSTMVWLEPNLPESYNRLSMEHDKLSRLKEDAQFLAEELGKERDSNRDLQKEIIEGRKRSDEMCSLMTIMRSETEAVLNR
mmetsp:Transcript_1523/g.2414  ORF Transcript_1523/g.2414 Transcript_1523/m.2414 type:complete len:727 (+) Transcript_1523:229-2409(+)